MARILTPRSWEVSHMVEVGCLAHMHFASCNRKKQESWVQSKQLSGFDLQDARGATPILFYTSTL